MTDSMDDKRRNMFLPFEIVRDFKFYFKSYNNN
jgi:hypothetical protein